MAKTKTIITITELQDSEFKKSIEEENGRMLSFSKYVVEETIREAMGLGEHSEIDVQFVFKDEKSIISEVKEMFAKIIETIRLVITGMFLHK